MTGLEKDGGEAMVRGDRYAPRRLCRSRSGGDRGGAKTKQPRTTQVPLRSYCIVALGLACLGSQRSSGLRATRATIRGLRHISIAEAQRKVSSAKPRMLKSSNQVELGRNCVHQVIEGNKRLFRFGVTSSGLIRE